MAPSRAHTTGVNARVPSGVVMMSAAARGWNVETVVVVDPPVVRLALASV